MSDQPSAMTAAPGDYPVRIDVAYPREQSRLLAALSIPFFLARIVLLIPAFIVLYALGIAAGLVAWIAFWAVAFTGHYPEGMHQFVAGYIRWQARANAYLLGLTDRYPPFRLAD